MRKFVLETLETFLTSIIVLFVIYLTVAMPEQVSGASMEPSFHTGERILVEKLTKLFKPYGRGDVVVLNPPGNDSIDYVKRVIGLPGDIIKIYDCKVYVSRDGLKYELQEGYLAQGTCTLGGPVLQDGRAFKVESGQYLVLGDNRGHSADSRYFGLVDKNRIIGRVIFRFWPPNKLGFM